MGLFYVQIAISFFVCSCAAAIFIWLLYRLACMFDDVRYLADVAQANGAPVERKRSPLRFIVIAVGTVVALYGFSLTFGLNLLAWLP